MKLTIIESPYAGDIDTNIKYLKRCMAHSLMREEAPFASHLLYSQLLDDSIYTERTLGILCGYEWLRVADIQAFYTDLGWSPGMIAAYEIGRQLGKKFEIRALDGPRRKFPGYASS